MTNFGKLDWDLHLKRATRAYNISYSRPLDIAPYELLHKKMPQMVYDKNFMQLKLNDCNISKRIQELPTRLAKYKQSYVTDKVHTNKFVVGQKVWICQPAYNASKLETKWNDIGVIVQQFTKSYIVRLQDGKNGKVNEEYLRPYYEEK
ncbi:hypothetical protein BDAP_001589 [Binucleata daphniae]